MKFKIIIPILVFSLLVGVVSAVALIRTHIFILNNDDDSTWAELYIDGVYRGGSSIGALSRSYLGLYYLTPGNHSMRLRWSDPDLCGPKEKTTEVKLTGLFHPLIPTVDSVYLNTELNTTRCVLEREKTVLKLYIKNIDDDDLWVDVIVDTYYKTMQVSRGGTEYYGEFTGFAPGEITIKLRWLDPDFLEFKEKSYKVYVGKGETVTETFSTVRNKYGL